MSQLAVTLPEIDAICDLAAYDTALRQNDRNAAPASPAAAKKAAIAYLAQAQKLGAPPEHWFFERNHGYSSGYRQMRSAALSLIQSAPASWKEAIETIIDAGANPWVSEATYYKTHSPNELTVRELSGASMGALIFSTIERAGMRSLLLKSALISIQYAPPHAFSDLILAYDKAVKNSSKTSKGMMGTADKLAKSACEILIARQTELNAAAKTPAEKKAAQEAISDATERLAAKKEKTMAVDPAKLKKETSYERQRRLSAILSLVQSYSDQPDLIRSAFELTPWLSETPMLASIPFDRAAGSLVHVAISSNSLAAVEALEALDANVWLAAAQNGDGNACRWVISRFRGEPEFVAPLARMLLRGAWLDGAPDPKERCVALCSELASDKSAYASQTAQSFLAAMELQSLEEIISGPAASAAPKKRSSL